MNLTLEKESPNSARVLDDGVWIGGIDRIGPDEWQNSHVTDGKPLGRVPLGPYRTLELAFEAYRTALASA